MLVLNGKNNLQKIINKFFFPDKTKKRHIIVGIAVIRHRYFKSPHTSNIQNKLYCVEQIYLTDS